MVGNVRAIRAANPVVSVSLHDMCATKVLPSPLGKAILLAAMPAVGIGPKHATNPTDHPAHSTAHEKALPGEVGRHRQSGTYNTGKATTIFETMPQLKASVVTIMPRKNRAQPNNSLFHVAGGRTSPLYAMKMAAAFIAKAKTSPNSVR